MEWRFIRTFLTDPGLSSHTWKLEKHGHFVFHLYIYIYIYIDPVVILLFGTIFNLIKVEKLFNFLHKKQEEEGEKARVKQ